MIDTKSIREYLLETAIRGKLSDNSIIGNQKELLQQIENEYNYLLKEKKTKTIVDVQMISEGLFELPNSWIWSSLGKLCVLLSRGKSPKYSEVKKYPVFAQKCNQPTGLALEKALFLDETTLDKWQDFFRLVDGDVLINSTGTGTMGRIGYFESGRLDPNYPFMVPDSHITVARLGKGIVSRFIYYVLRSPSLQRIMEKQFRGSTNQKEFYIDSVASIPIPLPPTETQEKIVGLLNNANIVLDTIDELQARYTDNLTMLKSKLIDLAIQGKLTEQLPEDGEAEELFQRIQNEKQALIKAGKIKKEKPLSEINTNEIPLEIPRNWCWCRLQSIYNFIDYRGATPTKTSEGVPFITAKNVRQGYVDYSILEFISEEDFQKRKSRGISHKGDLLFTTEAPMGYAAIADLERFSAGQRLITLQQYTEESLLENKYYMYAISARFFQKQLDEKCSGTTVKGIKADRLKQFLIPLPPLAEQKRIVAKLDDVLKMVEQ